MASQLKLDFLCAFSRAASWRALALSGLFLAASHEADASGVWTALAHAPPFGLNNALLLSDGTVICGDGGSGWYRLTPDNHGSYVNGTWSALAATHYTRLFYSSDVLTNGNVYVAGGEYGTGTAHAELYNTLNNTWSDIPQPAANPSYSDAVSKLLPNGNVLQGTTGGGVWIYNPILNNITAANSARNQNEACWVRLPNDNVLTVDAFGQQSEHYVPALGTWSGDNNVPVELYGWGGEMGAGFVLPNGNVFYIGGTTHTAIYTPGSTPTAAGTWVAGPEMVFGANALGAVDAPAAMMANGNILCALGTTNGFGSTTYFYEYDYLANAFTQVNGPTGTTLNTAPFATSMLDLPDGSVLYIAGQGSTRVYTYMPNGAPLAAGQPVINSVSENGNGSYHLTGTGLNGITGGAAYGDDWQMDTDYPLVRMTNLVTSFVYYARTYSWSGTTIQTGSKVVSTEFSLPAGLPSGNYSLVVAANGNASAPVSFTYSPLSAPTGLTATVGSAKLSLSWNAVGGATAYNVLRSTTGTNYYLPLVTVTGTNYTNAGLTNGVTYYYVVNAVGTGGPSSYSAPLAAVPFGPPPAPTGVVAGPESFLGVGLYWNPVPGAVNYNVKRSTSSGGPFSFIASRSNPDYTDTNVVAGTTYYYVVSSVSAGGESPNSAQVFANPSNSGDVTSGLQAFWRFDDGSGTTTADSTGHANTGTLINGPSWIAPGRIGPSDLSFAAASEQYVSVPNSATLNMTAGITITAWINPVDWSGNRRVVQKGNSDNQYRLLAENNVFKFHLNGVNTLTTTLPPSNTWTHVAATWNGSSMVIYFNGQPQATMAASGSITTTTDPLAIGTKNTSTATGDYWNGQIDEVRIYNRALTLSEINTVMHAGDTPPTTPTGLAAAPGNGRVSLNWTPVASASSYNVKRSNSSGGPYTIISTEFAPGYIDTGLTNGVAYYYVVSAINSTNESPDSTQASAVPGVGVVFFQDIDYSGPAGRLLGAGNYTLSQLQSLGVPNDSASSCWIPNGWTVVAYQNDSFGGVSWTLTSDTPDFTALSGLNDNISSVKITGASLPTTPLGVSAMAGSQQVTVSWGAVFGATAYNVKRASTSGGPYTLLATTTARSYTDSGLTNGATYYYVVSAVNAFGEGANSAEVSGTPSSPPVFLTVTPSAPGQFSFQFQGINGQNYVVLTSTNLVDWAPIYTNQPSGGIFTYVETNATDSARFYRVTSN